MTTPESNRKAIRFVPDATMNSLANQAWRDVLQKSKPLKDPKLVKQVSEIGKRIARASEANFAWEFKVLDDPKMINAFCLPNGKIAVYSGMIKVAKTHGGIAAVLGHEVAHAVLKHGAERVSQNILVQFGLVAASQLKTDKKYQPYILAALGLGLQFGVLMPYSRYHESEADHIGLKYMAKAGYDPKEAVELWRRMAKKGQSVPEFLSTHPHSSRRARDLEKSISAVSGLYLKSEKQDSQKLLR